MLLRQKNGTKSYEIFLTDNIFFYNKMVNYRKKFVRIEIDFIYKICRSKPKYENEKNFYLYLGCNYDFIPKLLDYDDDKNLLIIENVGEPIDKKDLDLERIKLLYTILHLDNIYHNDYRSHNIIFNSFENKYYLIDFEYYENKFNDFRKQRTIKHDMRKELFPHLFSHHI